MTLTLFFSTLQELAFFNIVRTYSASGGGDSRRRDCECNAGQEQVDLRRTKRSMLPCLSMPVFVALGKLG